jgi:hypothetical protein
LNGTAKKLEWNSQDWSELDDAAAEAALADLLAADRARGFDLARAAAAPLLDPPRT